MYIIKLKINLFQWQVVLFTQIALLVASFPMVAVKSQAVGYFVTAGLYLKMIILIYGKLLVTIMAVAIQPLIYPI